MKRKTISRIIVMLLLLLSVFAVQNASPDSVKDLRAQGCSKLTSNSGALLACDGTYPSECGSADPDNDRLSCDDGFVEAGSTVQGNHNPKRHFWNATYYNASITDCSYIKTVRLCFHWANTLLVGSAPVCGISIDNQNGTNYTLVNSTCASILGDDFGFVCQNVTANKSWSCSNFFGPNVVGRAFAVFNYSTTGTLITDQVSFNLDALFYNVSYITPPPKFIPEDAQMGLNDSAVYENDSVQISTNSSDENEISMVIFSHNVSGSWANFSNSSVLTGMLGVNYTVNLSSNASPGAIVGLMFHANDSDGSWNSSTISTFQMLGVRWNQSSLLLSGILNSPQPSKEARIDGYGTNTEVNVTCYKGDCGEIYSNFTRRDISDTFSVVTFNCSTAAAGSFYANFSVNSTQDIYEDNLSVGCTISSDDSTPPDWIDPLKNDSQVEQYDFVFFNATWTDNVNLSSFRFSSNSSGIWLNYTNYSFQGPLNVSNFTLQINASPGSVVGWTFYANDSSNNFNSIDEQSFYVVSQYHIFYGDVSDNIVLGDASNISIIAWLNSTKVTGNIFVTDSDSLNGVSWTALFAIGKDTALNSNANDWEDIDFLFGTTSYNDSINRTWTFDGEPRNKTNFVVQGSSIINVSTINSTNTSNFVTGILWDSSDSGNAEFDTTDIEDLVFITKVDNLREGMFGSYNYEIKIPARLKSYRTPNTDDSVSFYSELT